MIDQPASPNLNIEGINHLREKPEPFAPGDSFLWTDPYVAKKLLEAHLDPTSDVASRRPKIIDQSLAWITETLALPKDACILDLGCGPGLYASRLARNGFKVTGVDISQNSIEYAIQKAREDGLEIEYHCQDYLQIEDESRFDAALLIYGDLCPLSPEARRRLFANVRRALKPGGYFVLDVTTPRLRQRRGLKNSWYTAHNGFWRPGWHLVLEQGFAYDGDLYLDQYIIIENGSTCVYRNWFQDYTADTIRAETESNGFILESLWSDLTGAPYCENSDWIGVIGRRI
jgi:SAM-dependent methyltransferase